MQWEQLTATDFASAVKATGVCILPLGVLEKHSEHLPLGTDFLVGHRVACLAGEREPAVIFPPFYFGQIYEARCFPGAFTLPPGLLLELLQSVLDEIGRNGFKKIILYNAHGGNTHLLRFLAQSQLWEHKPYTLYMPTRGLSSEAEKQWEAMRATDFGGHACEEETSMVLGILPEWVKMDRVPEHPARPLDRMGSLPPTYTGAWWYADYPDHYAGDARAASIEKGKFLINAMADHLAEYVAAIKADTVLPALEDEFFHHAGQLGKQ